MNNLMFKNYDALIKEAKELIDEGTNIEYTRGVLEIICSFVSFSPDNCHADNVLDLANQIGLSREVIDKLY